MIEYIIPEVPKKESKKQKSKITLSKGDLKSLGIPYKKLKLKSNSKGDYKLSKKQASEITSIYNSAYSTAPLVEILNLSSSLE